MSQFMSSSRHLLPNPSCPLIFLSLRQSSAEKNLRRKITTRGNSSICSQPVKYLHNNTASLQLANDPRQEFLDQFLHLVVIIIVLTLALLITILWLMLLSTLIPSTLALVPPSPALLLTTMMLLLLALVIMLALTLVMVIAVVVAWHVGRATSEIDVHPPCVFLRGILQTELLTDLFYTRLDLLDVVDRVVSFAYYDVEVILAILLRVADALLEDLFGLFDELTVEINGVVCDTPVRVVLAEDEV